MRERRTSLPRLSRYQFGTALFLIFSLVFLIVRPGIATSSASDRTTGHVKQDGEKIFRGLLFGEEGPIADKFPQIWKRREVAEQLKHPEKSKAWNAFKEKVIVSIRKKDPTFFKRFGDEIQ